MNVIGGIVAGLVGTLAMTLLMMIAPMMGMPKMDITNMLGTMFMQGGGARPFGVVVHFMMGAVFGIVYVVVWNFVGAPNVLWGAILGVLHGIVAMASMPMMVKMHPRPPQMQMGGMMGMGLILGHLVFGVVTALVYAGFAA